MTEPHGINKDPKQDSDDMLQAPEYARKKGLDGHDVAEIGSMITSDPPSSNMGEDEEDKEKDDE